MISNKLYPRLVLVSARTLPPGLAVSTETRVLIASSYLLQAVEFGDRLVNLPVQDMLAKTREEWNDGKEED